MKESLKTIAGALALSLCCIAPAAAAQKMVSIRGDEVNMRSGAGTQHDALWTLGRGYPLRVVESRGKWVKVRDFENDEGWIYRPLTGNAAHHVVKAKIANIRKGPGTGTRIVGKAQYGEVLRTVERRKEWVKVRQEGGATGWIAKRLLWGW